MWVGIVVSVGNWWKNVRGGVYACGKGVWVEMEYRTEHGDWCFVW